MLRLDTPHYVGARRIALLCEQRTESAAWGTGMLHFHARKLPVAVVILEGTCLRAFDLRGQLLDPETLDAACPGLIQAMIQKSAT